MKNKPQKENLEVQQPVVQREDYVIKTLKAKFFSLIKEEKLGKTPEITKELDYLVEAIRELEAENIQ